MKNAFILTVLTFGFLSCGNDKKESKPKEEIVVQTEFISNTIDLKGTDDMKFDKTQFTVKAGEEVTLNFTNVGVLPLETMGHNVVVLEKDADVKTFATASAKAKETDYISDLYITDIIAQTKLLGPGESEIIKFTLKEPGEYPFICTFPGHWIAMKGTIIAQ
jgi:azurin